MNLLITGGAGYIGSHTVRKLKQAGHDIIIFDNLSAGHKKSVENFNLIIGDLANKNLLKKVFAQNNFDAVIHFAGLIEAGESMIDPKRFFENNVVCGMNLLEVMLEYNVKKIVFSSSAAVYGESQRIPIEETDQKNPTNIYGLTKLIFEQILDSYDSAYGLKSISLRYFNAAGADPSGEIGEHHKTETHLIPLVLEAALGKRESIKIFGTDYSTPDGTCIRDYIHVCDLADAHVLALAYLKKNNQSDKFNLGNERGSSVLEVIEMTKKITGINFPVIQDAKRIGDPIILCASSKKAQEVLGWKPKFGSIEDMIKTAWNWHKNNPNGFE